MGATKKPELEDLESSLLNHTSLIPEDKYNFAYMIYFMIGLGDLLPWNVFITAIDYFSHFYPNVPVDRIFAAIYMPIGFLVIVLIIFTSHKYHAFVRINVGLSLFVVSLVLVPVLDACYLMGCVGLYGGFYITALAVGLAAVGDSLVATSILGSASLLPKRYMQAFIAGSAASGILVTGLRIFTKAVLSQDVHGLQKSANLYFAVSIVIEFLCLILYNILHRLPVIKYYNDLKIQHDANREDTGPKTRSVWRSSAWDTLKSIKWYGFGIVLIYVVTLAIFPGYITEDVHSQRLKDWYPIILILTYNLGGLFGTSLTSVYLIENAKIAIGSCVGRLVFFPLFAVSLYGPMLFRTEIPITILTLLLGVTNGYLASVLLISAPKKVKLQHAEVAGTLSALFLAFGQSAGAVVAWLWVI